MEGIGGGGRPKKVSSSSSSFQDPPSLSLSPCPSSSPSHLLLLNPFRSKKVQGTSTNVMNFQVFFLSPFPAPSLVHVPSLLFDSKQSLVINKPALVVSSTTSSRRLSHFPFPPIPSPTSLNRLSHLLSPPSLEVYVPLLLHAHHAA